MNRLAVLHTGAFLVDLFKRLIGERYPGISSFHMLDESLIQDLLAKGESPSIMRRIATHASLAEAAGADLLVFTCSSTSPAVDLARKLVDIPIVKIDDAMAEKAVGIGGKIGLVCSTSSTVGPSTSLVREHAAKAGKTVEIVHELKSDAFKAIVAGDRASHDAIITEAALRLAGSCNVVLLAQASMAHLQPVLKDRVKVPVLASPTLCVESLARYMQGAEE
jgi:Asp/Glu/hydantoin racemase